MRRRDTYWSLFHAKEKRQIDDLKTENVEAIFEILPVKDQRDWLIWKEGFRTWKPLSEFPQLLIGLRSSTQVAQPAQVMPIPPKITVTTGKNLATPLSDQDDSTVHFALSEDTGLGDRDTRFPKRWDVRLVGEKKITTNQTIDVSMHGMQLRDPLPDDLANYFNVEVRAGSQKIPLLCSKIETKDGAPSRRIKIESCEYPNALQTALLQV
jgi:hypothetical protein